MEKLEAIRLLDRVRNQAAMYSKNKESAAYFQMGLLRTIIMDHLQGYRSIEDSLRKLPEKETEHA